MSDEIWNVETNREVDQKKQMAIKELLLITNSIKLTESVGNTLIQLLMENIKDNFKLEKFNIIREEMKALIYEEVEVKESLHSLLYPVYHKYLTLDDLNGLILFYKSSLGQKLISVMPEISQKSLEIGQIWGQTLIPKIKERVKSRFEKEGIKTDWLT